MALLMARETYKGWGVPLVGYPPICTDLLSGVQSDHAIAEQRGKSTA